MSLSSGLWEPGSPPHPRAAQDGVGSWPAGRAQQHQPSLPEICGSHSLATRRNPPASSAAAEGRVRHGSQSAGWRAERSKPLIFLVTVVLHVHSVEIPVPWPASGAPFEKSVMSLLCQRQKASGDLAEGFRVPPLLPHTCQLLERWQQPST